MFDEIIYTVNIDIFALYIFPAFCAFIKCLRKNMYIVKITCIMLHRGNNIKNGKINQRKIANFRKCPKTYTHKNIYVYSICRFYWVSSVMTN